MQTEYLVLLKPLKMLLANKVWKKVINGYMDTKSRFIGQNNKYIMNNLGKIHLAAKPVDEYKINNIFYSEEKVIFLDDYKYAKILYE